MNNNCQENPTQPTDNPEYSVVIPVYNEEQVLPLFTSNLISAMDGLRKGYELVFVDDGSTDKTWQILNELSKSNPNIIAYRLSRNFGHQKAIYAGLQHAKGRTVGIIDGDGQDPVEVLVDMFNCIEPNYDVIFGVRKKRKEGPFKRFCYFLFYRFLNRITKIDIPLDSGDFSVMDREVVQFIINVNDPNPFIRGLRSWYGGKQKAYEYERDARQGGESKYSFLQLLDLAINGVTSCSKWPLRFAVYLGGGVSLATLLYSMITVLLKIFFDYPSDNFSIGWTSLIAIIGLVGGMNIFLIGVIGEYLSHVFDATMKHPTFIIKESTVSKNNKLDK